MPNISPIHVSHTGPEGAEVLVIGESPGSDETRLKQPFVGKSGELLRQVLSANGFLCASSQECENEGGDCNNKYNIRFANLCNFQPLSGDGFKTNDFNALEGSQELKNGLRELHEYIQRWKSRIKICIILGERPLQYLSKKFGISKWRGSVIDVDGIRFLPTYHPAYIARFGSDYPVFSFDISKAFRIYSSGYKLPEFSFTINPQGLEFEECLYECKTSSRLAVDIETVKNTNRILCIGFATGRSRAICITNKSESGLDAEVGRFLYEVLTESSGAKIFHNGLFDIEVLHNNGIEVNNFTFDTMVAQHVLAPELSKGLDFITSVYTDIPYYKDRGRMALPENEKGWGKLKDDQRLTVYEYNCLDCVATFSCYEEMKKEIDEDPDHLSIFNYEMSMHDTAFHITRAGMLIDEERRLEIKRIVEAKFVEDQRMLNAIAGFYINVGSSPQKKKLLYEVWKLPERTNEDSKLAADEDAIISLISYAKDYYRGLYTEAKKYEWMQKCVGLGLILRISGYRKLLGSYIDVERHHDGRARSSYKVTGTETGRWSCAKYLDDTGWNAQTLPRDSIESPN
jgi:uracil-DNA glycosylase